MKAARYWPRSPLRVRVLTKQKTRLLNLLKINGVDVWNIRSQGDGIELTVMNRSLDVFEKTLAKADMTYELLAYQGAANRLRFLFSHKMIFLSLGLLFALLFYLNTFIFFIDINAPTQQLSQEIRLYLNTNGVREGMKKDAFSKEDIEMLLYKAYPDLIDVTVNFTGAKLVLDITDDQDKNNADASPFVDEDTPCDVVAAFDGVIDELEVYSGTARKKQGESVKKGEIIIEGVGSYRDYNDQPVAYALHAKGKVIAYQTEVYEDVVVFRYVPSVQDADSVVRKEYEILGARYAQKQTLDANWVLTSSERVPSSAFAFLQVYTTTNVYYERINCRVKTQEEIENEAYAKVKENFIQDDRVFSVEYTLKIVQDVVYVDVHVMRKVDLGQDLAITDQQRLLDLQEQSHQ